MGKKLKRSLISPLEKSRWFFHFFISLFVKGVLGEVLKFPKPSSFCAVKKPLFSFRLQLSVCVARGLYTPRDSSQPICCAFPAQASYPPVAWIGPRGLTNKRKNECEAKTVFCQNWGFPVKFTLEVSPKSVLLLSQKAKVICGSFLSPTLVFLFLP